MKKLFLAIVLLLSLQGCYMGIDPWYHGHGGGHHGSGGQGTYRGYDGGGYRHR